MRGLSVTDQAAIHQSGKSKESGRNIKAKIKDKAFVRYARRGGIDVMASRGGEMKVYSLTKACVLSKKKTGEKRTLIHVRLQLDEFQVKPGSPLCTSLLLAIFFTMSISSWKAKTNNKILKVITIHQKNRNTSCLIQPVGKKGGDFI